jgi:hypothetical protein
VAGVRTASDGVDRLKPLNPSKRKLEQPHVFHSGLEGARPFQGA